MDEGDLTYSTQDEFAELRVDEDERGPRPTNGGECPDCRRVMSVREGSEQGICNDCLGGAF